MPNPFDDRSPFDDEPAEPPPALSSGAASDLFGSDAEVQSAQARRGIDDKRALLMFEVGEELHALPLDSVRRVLTPVPLTAAPRVPPFVRGVCNVSGRVVTIAHLGLFLGTATGSPHPRGPDRFVLLDGEHQSLGLWVDSVLGIGTLPEQSGELLDSIDRSLHSAVVRHGDRLLHVLDPKRLVHGMITSVR